MSQPVSLASQVAALEKVASHAPGCAKAINGSAKGAELFKAHVEAAIQTLCWCDANRALIAEANRLLKARAA